MNSLAFETAFGKFSISLFHNHEMVDSYICEKENEQAELLIPAIEEVLKRNNISYQDLDIIAVSTGPGSFTGVRIGLAAAKGLALATKAKLIGISSLEASAYKQGGGKIYLNAGRAQAYFQEFDVNFKPLNEPELVTYSGSYSPLPDAESIGRIATHDPRTTTHEPVYIRKPDAKFRLRQGNEKDIPWLTAAHAACFENNWNEDIISASLQNGECVIADRLGFIIHETIGDECEIKTIAVLPEARRKGVASFILTQMLKNCREQGVRQIFLEVEADNPAVKLYESFAFSKISERKDYYGENRHAVLMRLAI